MMALQRLSCLLAVLLFLQGSREVSPLSLLQSKAPSRQCKVLILPGFGNSSEDYTMPDSIVSSLLKRGWTADQISVLDVERPDWLKVFVRGAFDLDFWRSDAPPTNPGFCWYLERVAKKVAELKEDEQMVLLGHSAGGWLGRAAVGFGCEDGEDDDAPKIDKDKILGIVTLGAPNLPPPPTVMDMTRGALRITNERFPGAYFQPSLFYISVIGNSLRGEEQTRKTPLEPTTPTGFAYNSYDAVCGDGNAMGDGVVPVVSAHLDDAQQITLDGVLHSIYAPNQWYGADEVIDLWHDTMLKEIKKTQRNKWAEKQPFFVNLVQ